MPSPTLFGAETEYGFTTESISLPENMRERQPYHPLTVAVNEFIGASLEAIALPYTVSGIDLRDLLGLSEAARRRVRIISSEAMRRSATSESELLDRLRVIGVSGARLVNGARFYQDCGHPEYSTPECTSAAQLVAYYRAGDLLVEAGRRALLSDEGIRVYLYRDNSDRNGSSFAAHENYLLNRDTFEEVAGSEAVGSIASILETFFVTRQIVFGAGKVGRESPSSEGISQGAIWFPKDEPVDYQLSQRADFTLVRRNIDTMARRPIINLRDMSYVSDESMARLHVIVGDANMCEVALWLKFGITALVLHMLEDGFIERAVSLEALTLQSPVEALHAISRDPSLTKTVPFKDGMSQTALQIQFQFHALLERYLCDAYEANEEEERLVVRYGEVLTTLADDPMQLVGVLDWVTKLVFLQKNLEDGMTWDHPEMTTADVLYHSTNPDEGLYLWLEQRGYVERVVTDADIANALRRPPTSTRAYIRGLLVERFGDRIVSMGWDTVVLRDDKQSRSLRFLNPFLSEADRHALDAAIDVQQVIDILITRGVFKERHW